MQQNNSFHAILCFPHVQGLPPEDLTNPFEDLSDALAAIVRVQAGLQQALTNLSAYALWYLSPLTTQEQQACRDRADEIAYHTRCWLLMRADILDMLQIVEQDAGREFYRQPLGSAVEFLRQMADNGVQELDRYHVRCGGDQREPASAPTAVAFLSYLQPPMRVFLHAWFCLLHGLLSEAAVVRQNFVAPPKSSLRDQILDALFTDVQEPKTALKDEDFELFDEFGAERGAEPGAERGAEPGVKPGPDSRGADSRGAELRDADVSTERAQHPPALEKIEFDDTDRAALVPPAWRDTRPKNVPGEARWWCCVPGCGRHSGSAQDWLCPVHRCRQHSEAFVLADGDRVEFRSGNEWHKAVFRTLPDTPAILEAGARKLPAKGLQLRANTPSAPRALHLRYAVRLVGPGTEKGTVRVANLNNRPFLLGGGRKANHIDLPANAVRLPAEPGTSAREQALAAAPADGSRLLEVRRFNTWEPAKLLLGAEEVSLVQTGKIVPVTHFTGIRSTTKNYS